MRRVPNFVVMSCELGNNMLAPLLAFIFFAANSPLFSQPTAMAKRSLLFGLCLSLYKFGSIFANTVITALSDQYGRKMALRCTALGLLMVAGCGVGGLYLHSPALLISGFLLVSLLDTNKATGPAMMGDISAPHNRVHNMAEMQCVIAIGACLGPIIGGQLAEHSPWVQTAYALPFMIAGLIAALNLWIIRYCPETLPQSTHHVKIPFKKILTDYILLLQEKKTRWILFIFILCQLSWSTYYEFIPPVLKNIFHFSPAQVGFFVGLIAFWLIIAASLVIRWLMRYFNNAKLLWLSTISIIVGTLCAALASSFAGLAWSQALLWISALPTAMGDVIFFSLIASALSQHSPAHQQGKMMGLILIIAMLVWSLTALLGSTLLTVIANGPLLFAPLGALGLWLALKFSSEEMRNDTVS